MNFIVDAQLPKLLALRLREWGMGSPVSLLLVCTGNISNRQLLALFEKNLELILGAVMRSRLVELNQTGIIMRDA